MALPLVIRGRWLAVDLAGAGLWVVGLIVAQVALGDALATDVALDQAAEPLPAPSWRRS